MAENEGKRKLSEDEERPSENGDIKRLKVCEPQELGTLLYSGLTDYTERNDSAISKSPALQWSPFQYESLKGIKIRKVSTGPVSYHTLAISEDYKVYSWGYNNKGQLGHGDCRNRRNPTLVESLSGYKVVDVATGRMHSLVLTDEGQVFAFGDNSSGQCGVGSKDSQMSNPKRIDYDGASIVKFACGSEFSLILDDLGTVYSFGHPEHGQLGHGTDSREIVAGKGEVFHFEHSPIPITSYREIDDGEVIFHGQPRIVDIQCGNNHSCAIDEKQRIFTWGFGGYGRLGHNSTQNEMVPRLMKCWYRITGRADGGIIRVACGSQFNIVQTTVAKCSYYFGQINMNGEAAMYPKSIDDLQGWNVRRVVCSMRGWAALADDSVIAAQCSPGFGQLGMGFNKKSSARPLLVEPFEKMKVHHLGLGYMHGVFLVRNETEKDEKEMEKFEILSFEDNDKKVEEAPPAKGKGRGKAASKGKATARKAAPGRKKK
eukprot:TCONS_00008205-protein